MKRISFPLKPEMKDTAVADLQSALVFLGLDVSDAEKNSQFFGATTQEAVKRFQAQHQLRVSGAVDEATANLINRLINGRLGDGETTKLGALAVAGKVISPSRAGVGGLRVEIVDRNIDGDKLLKEVTTADDGSFQATLDIADLRKQRPDLQARAYVGQTRVGVSGVKYNAGGSEILNIEIDTAAAAVLPSEHETLTRALSTLFKGNLRDLKETDDHQDITYLANKTGWDARAVALAALADQFASRAGGQIEPVFFYALFRAGMPVNEDALYHANARAIESALQKSIDAGVIPKARAREIPELIKRFQSLSAQKLLSGPALAGVSALKDMLSISRLDDARQQQFAQLYAANRTDMPAFWAAVSKAFDKATVNRLQVDGKLAFLTINNAGLMQRLHATAGRTGVNDPLQLAQLGLYRPQKWDELMAQDVAVPPEIPGATDKEKRANYAEYMAAQIRLSYPTAAVADMVKNKAIPLSDNTGKPAAAKVVNDVVAFLTEQQGKFEIGINPVEPYVKKNQIEIAPETLAQVKKLQRVYQLTPSDDAMTGLMKNGIDAAYHVVRYQRDNFVKTFAKDLGGDDQATLVYDRSVQVHNAVLNVAVSFLTASNAPGIGVHSPAQVIDPVPQVANAGDIIAYSKLEELFGEMDYCSCDHCRSILSPAAYLVDLLNFIDVPPTETGKDNPQTVLLERRPDIQHLPLTCENTNTALPYIDVVNETLEYFVANNVQKMSLNGYVGHDTGDAASPDLLASPQSFNDGVRDAAYTLLRGEQFPAPLPFHQPLENLRRYFDKFEVPLALAMERLRKNDDLERGANPYGWRDIWMEEVGLSRAEYDILTTSIAAPNTLWQVYGFPSGTSDSDIINGNVPADIPVLSNAKQYTRRLDISYDDLVGILKTRFINPDSDLIEKVERLGVSFAALKALKDAAGTSGDAAFDALLPTGAGAPDPAQYGGDIKAWVKNDDNYNRIMNLITLVDPTGSSDTCNFENLELRRAQPMASLSDISTRIDAVAFVRLLRFIRLWKKTGWTIDQTDAAICALYRSDLATLTAADVDTLDKLNVGFLNLLPRVGIIERVTEALNLSVKRDLLSLLACWSNIGAAGSDSLYAEMFLNPAVAQQDDAFADDGYGNYLDGSEKLGGHAETLRSAFNLTADEYDRINSALGFDGNTPLTLANLSQIFRRGWLARKLKISVRELLLLTSLTGLDPFAAPDPTRAAIVELIALVQDMKAMSLKSQAGLYLIWNQDLSGKSAPQSAQVTELARTLRSDFAAIDDQFAAAADTGVDVARVRMALVYGQETTDAFFALLDNTLTVDVAYTHSSPTLEGAITSVDANLAYDGFKHRLSHAGILDSSTRNSLKAIGGVSSDFKNAVDALFDRGEEIKGLFFTRYPELLDPFTMVFVLPLAQRHAAFLAAFQPALSRKRKRQQALQRLSANASVALEFTQAMLDPPAAPYPLHADGDSTRPALDDVVALETPGLTARIYYQNTASGSVDLNIPNAADLDYASGGANPLPPNTTTPGDPISGIWQGMLEAPEAGYYNIAVEADAGANVKLEIDGQTLVLTQNGNVWRNTSTIELKAGTLHDMALTVEKVKDTLSVTWETPKRAREVIPSRYLYPTNILTPFEAAYVRFLKLASLAAALKIAANETAFLATHADYEISGDKWPNALPVSGDPSAPVAIALLKSFQALLSYARMTAELAPDDERLLQVLQDPAAATATAQSLLYTLTLWDVDSLTALLTHFGGNIASLSHPDWFVRVYDAFELIRSMGISGGALTVATSNEPTADTVRNLQAALRARYAAADWRDVVRPVNDEMRGLQRDALVAYILQQMRSKPASAQIDTADKLFEYFLMDVEMESCMQTSRIRHALSSAQLFIERCLMNLEPRVSPASVDAKQWEWRKRYRVWEANRKVFLFPENWLEPELRDDKSPIFKEIESELLQGDITDDTAATALLNYLTKLEEVAKLEPCGIHHVEANPALRTGVVEHVVARTAGAHRKYYYRRRDGGSWFPWEQIKLDIEDNPVLPVVWKGRLFLFWLRLIKQTPVDPNAVPSTSTKTGAIANLALGDIKSDAKTNATNNSIVTVRAVLCYSEYYNGKWQPVKTSDVDKPTTLGSWYADPNGVTGFNRARLMLSATQQSDALQVNIGGEGGSFFLLYNTHSLPVRAEDADLLPYVIVSKWRSLNEGSQHLFFVNYWNNGWGGWSVLTRDLLKGKLSEDMLQAMSFLQDTWDAPFFFSDRRHAFFVTTGEQSVRIHDYFGYGVAIDPGYGVAKVPPFVQEGPVIEVGPKGWGDGGPIGPGPIGPDPRVTDPSPVERFVTEDAYIKRGIGMTGNVTYGGRDIGPSGAVVKTMNVGHNS